MLDRTDIHIEVPEVDYEKLSSDRVGESSDSVRERVQAVWEPLFDIKMSFIPLFLCKGS